MLQPHDRNEAQALPGVYQRRPQQPHGYNQRVHTLQHVCRFRISRRLHPRRVLPATAWHHSHSLGPHYVSRTPTSSAAWTHTCRSCDRGILKHALGFLTSTIFAVIGAVLLLIGAVIWTVIVKKAQDINTFTVNIPNASPVPLGITVDVGNGILLAWAAWACLVASIIPYMIRCAHSLVLYAVR